MRRKPKTAAVCPKKIQSELMYCCDTLGSHFVGLKSELWQTFARNSIFLGFHDQYRRKFNHQLGFLFSIVAPINWSRKGSLIGNVSAWQGHIIHPLVEFLGLIIKVKRQLLPYSYCISAWFVDLTNSN